MEDSKSIVCAAEPPAQPVDAIDRSRANVKILVLLSAGHFFIDLAQGALPALLPFLKSVHNLSYAAAGTVMLAANLSSSIVQPVFGYFTDRISRPWTLPASVLIAGGGVALAGIAPGYGLLLAIVTVMGLGVAAYHPQGYKTATAIAGRRKATALSWFSLGGNVGFAVGPALVALLVTSFGLSGTLWLLLPSVLMTGLLLASLPRLSPGQRPGTAPGVAAATGQNMPSAMALLVTVVTIRSWTHLGFTTFVPFYYIEQLKSDPRVVGPLLLVFLGSGAVGTILAGPIADRWGSRRFMVIAFLAAAPLGVLFLLSRGVLAFVLLGLFGAILISTFSIAVVLGQAYLPTHAATASGLIVGFAIGMGGVGAALLGWVADHIGLTTTLWITALLPLAGFGTSLFLPDPRERKE